MQPTTYTNRLMGTAHGATATASNRLYTSSIADFCGRSANYHSVTSDTMYAIRHGFAPEYKHQTRVPHRTCQTLLSAAGPAKIEKNSPPLSCSRYLRRPTSKGAKMQTASRSFAIESTAMCLSAVEPTTHLWTARTRRFLCLDNLIWASDP
jgi:hypothetical protein